MRMRVSPGRRRLDPAALVVAGLLLLLGVLLFQDAVALRARVAYGIGPDVMLYVVGSALGILALAHLVVAFREGLPQPPAEADSQAVGWLGGGLVGLIACIGWGGGFIPAVALLFASTARAVGRRALLADLAIGSGLGLAIYLGFSKLLALGLPQGPLERLL
jgi:putative tricarboxylic transport membrane protein